MLKSGLTVGGLSVIVLTMLMELTGSRRQRIETQLALSALPELQSFARGFAARNGWDAAMAHRLEAASEETLLTLMRDMKETGDAPRRLRVLARKQGDTAVFEFIAAGGGENIEDRMLLLGEGITEESAEREISLRLLRHLACEVRHVQYHGADFVTVVVAEPKPTPGA